MRQRRQLIVNVLSNYGAFILYGIAGFVLTAYVVRHIGADAWGVVGLAMSLTSVTEILGRGMGQSLTKYLVEHFHKRDFELANKFINSHLLWLVGCAVLGAGVCGVLGTYVDRLAKMPDWLVPQARWAIWLMGLRVLICFPFDTFQSILRAYQRYDLINLVKSATIILRVVAVVLCFEFISAGVIPLILVTILSLLLERLLWMYYAFRVGEQLHFGRSFLSRYAVWVLFGIGGFMLIIDAAHMVGYEAVKWVLGAELSVLDVGAYAIIALLAATALSMVLSIATVLVPIVSKYQAMEKHETNILLTSLSTRYATIVASGLCIVPLFILRPFLSFLTGGTYTPAYLSELAISGAVVLLGQWSMLTALCMLQVLSGIGRVRFPAAVAVGWSVGGLGGVWAYLHWGGGTLCAAMIGISISRVVGSILHLGYGIRVLRLDARKFIVENIAVPGAVGVAVAMIGWPLANMLDVYTVTGFVLAGGILSLLYGIGTWTLSLSAAERSSVIGRLRPIANKLW